MERAISKERIIEAIRELDPVLIKNEDAVARCPICGGTIHIKYGKSYYTVKCETEGCIDAVSRGL